MDTDDPSQCKFTILSHAKCNSGKILNLIDILSASKGLSTYHIGLIGRRAVCSPQEQCNKLTRPFKRDIVGGFYLIKSYLI